MALSYRDNGREPRYLCCREAVTFGGPRCLSLSAQPVDALVAQLILAALAPSAIEVSLQVAEDVELERAAQHRHWAQRLERVRYEAVLARRRYEAVDPDMRLVARTLERDWEAALAAEQALEAEHARELARQPVRLQAAELAAIRRLAEDVPALWQAPTTTAGDRQAIARLVLDQVAVQANGERVEVACHWAGGVQTRHATTRPVRRFEQLHGSDQVLALIRDLRGQGCSAAGVAEQLNAAGGHRPSGTASMPPWSSAWCSATTWAGDGRSGAATSPARPVPSGPCKRQPSGSASTRPPSIAGCAADACAAGWQSAASSASGSCR